MAESEIKSGEVKFEFGKNWAKFLKTVNDSRIRSAEESLKSMLRVEGLKGKRFLDIGSGSGLFSLAALRLGAAEVRSFDYDPSSVGCAVELKRRYAGESPNWRIEQASVLDRGYLNRLGKFDVVYSWGGYFIIRVI